MNVLVCGVTGTLGSTSPPAYVPLSGTRDTFSHLPAPQTLTTVPSTENHAIGVTFPSGEYRKAGPEPEKRNITRGPIDGSCYH
jgi:hypothetical protein